MHLAVWPYRGILPQNVGMGPALFPLESKPGTHKYPQNPEPHRLHHPQDHSYSAWALALGVLPPKQRKKTSVRIQPFPYHSIHMRTTNPPSSPTTGLVQILFSKQESDRMVQTGLWRRSRFSRLLS